MVGGAHTGFAPGVGPVLGSGKTALPCARRLGFLDHIAEDETITVGPDVLVIPKRAINKLKQFRAVATRYDKRGYIFASTSASIKIWLRDPTP